MLLGSRIHTLVSLMGWAMRQEWKGRYRVKFINFLTSVSKIFSRINCKIFAYTPCTVTAAFFSLLFWTVTLLGYFRYPLL